MGAFDSRAVAMTESSDLKSVLQRPLIVGASVSGDHLTSSPGKRLALRYTHADQVRVIAGNGRLGRDNVSRLNAADLQDRTIVIGMDLFFWDSFAPDAEPSLKAIDHLLSLAKERHIPLILGEVPALMPGIQRNLNAVNSRIAQACKSYSRCRVLPLNSILHQVARDGHIESSGQKYGFRELLPDGLHISAVASDYLADQIAKLL